MTSISNTPSWIASAVFLGAALVAAPTPTPALGIKPAIDRSEEVQIKIRRAYDFEQEIRLTVKSGLQHMSPDERIEVLRALQSVEGVTLNLNDDHAIDVPNNLILGHAGGGAEIVSVENDGAALLVTALLRDRQGKIVKPDVSTIGAYTTAGQQLCVSGAPATLAPRQFVLLIDRSGSMASVISDVRAAAHHFINALPNDAQCRVGAFDDDWSFAARDGGGDGQCQPQNFDLSAIEVGGMTNVHGPLADAYDFLGQSHLTGHQKAVIVITDGQLNAGLGTAEALKAAKGDALTLIYKLGNGTDRRLQDLADSYVAHHGALNETLGHYFDVIQRAYNDQIALRIESCGTAALRAAE
ncbi:MAG: vWA domain-containing protein [Pseudomonadota bacterium]